MRELTYAPNAIKHPQYLPDGSAVWVEAGIRDRIQNGDPAMGWPGDPRIEVYVDGRGRLCLWRLEADGVYRCIMRSKPNLPLDGRAVQFLVDHDIRRGYDVAADIDRHNAKVDKDADDASAEAMGPAIDRLAWAVAKDNKTGAGW